MLVYEKHLLRLNPFVKFIFRQKYNVVKKHSFTILWESYGPTQAKRRNLITTFLMQICKMWLSPVYRNQPNLRKWSSVNRQILSTNGI
jgi:hypothetical protein